jgi:hypothetical protein
MFAVSAAPHPAFGQLQLAWGEGTPTVSTSTRAEGFALKKREFSSTAQNFPCSATNHRCRRSSAIARLFGRAQKHGVSGRGILPSASEDIHLCSRDSMYFDQLERQFEMTVIVLNPAFLFVAQFVPGGLYLREKPFVSSIRK